MFKFLLLYIIDTHPTMCWFNPSGYSTCYIYFNWILNGTRDNIQTRNGPKISSKCLHTVIKAQKVPLLTHPSYNSYGDLRKRNNINNKTILMFVHVFKHLQVPTTFYFYNFCKQILPWYQISFKYWNINSFYFNFSCIISSSFLWKDAALLKKKIN